MQSIGIILLAFFALIATINALNCSPVMCMIACPNGFEMDAQGCPICSCRRVGATGTSTTTARSTTTTKQTTRPTTTTKQTTRPTTTTKQTTRPTTTTKHTTHTTTRHFTTSR